MKLKHLLYSAFQQVTVVIQRIQSLLDNKFQYFDLRILAFLFFVSFKSFTQ
jgi:hypothetical protein